MTTFVVNPENDILAYGSPEEAKAAAGTAAVEIFSTQRELASLAAKWPASRLVDIWNSFAGAVPFDDLKPVKKFTDRKKAVARIWAALQRLNATVAPPAAPVAPKAAASTKEATAKKKAPRAEEGAPAREGSKKAIVLEMIRRPDGATLSEIQEATGWQAHSVRGFISGQVTKKMGIAIYSYKREDGERVYTAR